MHVTKKKSSAAKHTKNRNECKANKPKSKLSMKPLISMQQGTVKFWNSFSSPGECRTYWSSWHKSKYCTKPRFQFFSPRETYTLSSQHVYFVGIEEKLSPEKDCNLLCPAKAMAAQCALFKGKTRTTWDTKMWILHHDFSDVYSNQSVLKDKTSPANMSTLPRYFSRIPVSYVLSGFLLQAPCTKEFWRHDPYLCILGHTNITTPSCASDAKVQLQGYSQSWMCSHLLGTTVHLMSHLFIVWSICSLANSPWEVCSQASIA